ncbi:MAG: ABC transporter ATP-binding protein [Acidobacteriota bacterium]|jgi:ABC-2 type transport system ATP-binding protein|nr:ABC transporter ATP-binding protein [Acidobacteriota bacterium]
MNEPILAIRGLTKQFGEIRALDHLDLDLRAGEVFGLLGPNGAGKTTLISILSGTVRDFGGSVRFQGKDLFRDRELRAEMGIVPQDMAFFEELGARENLYFWGGLYKLSGQELRRRTDHLLETVELNDRAKEPVKNFSGGMKRRLNLAIGLIHQPRLLLLDEPTVGIDVQAKVKILDIIRRAAADHTAVVFTTHQLAEVESLCDRVAIMDKGRILAQGTLDELTRIVGEREIIRISGEFSAFEISQVLGNLPASDLFAIEDHSLTLALDSTAQIPGILETLFQGNVAVSDLKIQSPNLETVFLKLTGRSLRD